MEMGQIKSIPYSSSEILSVLEKKKQILKFVVIGKVRQRRALRLHIFLFVHLIRQEARCWISVYGPIGDEI